MKTTKFELIAFLVFIAILLAMIKVASGAAIPGTIVAAKITTGDTANTFSIGDTEEMGGTPKQVADATARDAIPADRRVEGMTAWVINESNEYRLVGGTNNANWVLVSGITNIALNVFTNDGTYVHLYGTTTNTAPYAFSKNGDFLIGTNVFYEFNASAGSIHALGALGYTDSNDPPVIFYDVALRDNTNHQNSAGIHGSAQMSPQRASWSISTGTKTGSTNTLLENATTGSSWLTAIVDTTNRAELDYSGLLTAQGFLDVSGTPGEMVAYGPLGRLTPTNVIFSSNAYITNIYVSNAFITNLTVQAITNVSSAYITNLYVSIGYITNLFTSIGYVTNLFSTTAYITNLFVDTAYITNLFVISEFVDNITVTNGITNLSLTANTVLQTDSRKVITNEVSGVVVQAPGNHVFSSSNYFGVSFTTSTNLCTGVPDFTQPESIFSTNNAVVFAAPVGVDTTKKTAQWILVNVTNTTAAAVTITPPANCHLVGTGYVTNLTQCWFQCYGGAFTNLNCSPVF